MPIFMSWMLFTVFFDKGPSLNYVDRIFEIFDPPPPLLTSVDIWRTLPPVYVDKKVYRKCIYIKIILKNFKVQN